MRFAKAVWKLLVGVKDALVLLFMLLFFSLLYAGLKASPRPIGEGVLALDLNGRIVEQPARADIGELVSGASVAGETGVHDLVAMLDQAASDDRVKAVALELDGFTGGGQTALADVGAAMDRVRGAKKPVLTYATGYGDSAYLLAAHASESWLSPMGAVLVSGPGGQYLFYKGLFDKLGVTANIYKVGTFKSAVEPYSRTDFSEPAKENLRALTGARLETWRENVAKARPQAGAGLQRMLSDPVSFAAGRDMARAALDAKLVDRVGDYAAFEQRLAALGGADDKDGFKHLRAGDYLKLARDARPSGPIGIVTIAGEIVDGKAGAGKAGGETIAPLIEKAVRRGDLKALVVRVDSPGGSAMASERIRQALMGAKAAGLPVVVSMGDVAASGGYWVTAGSDYIFAEPSTVTGSIGVFGILPSFQGTLAKLGLSTDGVKTSPLSGEPDLMNGPSPEASALVQAGVESTYARFLSLVAQGRHKSVADIDRIAQGRVWDGGTARQLGLVDAFGGLDAAVAKAAQLAELGDERGVTFLAPEASFGERLAAMLAGDRSADEAPADAYAMLAGSPKNALLSALARVEALMNGPTIQVACLECPAAPAAPRAHGGWLARWLGLTA